MVTPYYGHPDRHFDPSPLRHFPTPWHGAYAIRLSYFSCFERCTSRPTGRTFAPTVACQNHVFLGESHNPPPFHHFSTPCHGTYAVRLVEIR